MLLKFWGGTMIIICGALSGIYLSDKLKNRAKFMEEYIIFLTQAKAMIRYGNFEIQKILSEVSQNSLFSDMLQECQMYLSGGENFSSSWKNACQNYAEKGLMTKEDIPLYQNFGESFGNLGSEEEENQIQLYIELADHRLSRLREELLTKRRLYRVIGTFSGVMAAVILY